MYDTSCGCYHFGNSIVCHRVTTSLLSHYSLQQQIVSGATDLEEAVGQQQVVNGTTDLNEAVKDFMSENIATMVNKALENEPGILCNTIIITSLFISL